MILRHTLVKILESQEQRDKQRTPGYLREISGYSQLGSHAFIITGIRRCGKSTVMQQIRSELNEVSLFVNFEDPRLAGFDITDFEKLAEIATEKGVTTFFFDEIQEVGEWERFVRFKLDEGYKIFITGSNASLLSKELGTKLTGRHISFELFPFSYLEYLGFLQKSDDWDSMMEYIKTGGFPEYLKTGIPEILSQSFKDIIIRDISNRFGVRNSQMLQQLAIWLVSNVGKPISAGSLSKTLQIKSVTTVNDYLSYLGDAYLFFYINRFSYSQKKQLRNLRKVYCIDNGIIAINSRSFTEDKGRLLENLVFLELRRKYREMYYFQESKECDFVVFQKHSPEILIQVCWTITNDNFDREVNGLVEAMKYFNMDEGYIVTAEDEDLIKEEDKLIHILPFTKWVSKTLCSVR